jgi:hypothetical protein
MKRKQQIKQTTFLKNQKLITSFFDKEEKKDKIYGYNYETQSWHCSECGEDMGSSNPRQLCGKINCRNIY